MVDRAMLLRHLALAHEHVAKGEADVARQEDLVAGLEGRGHDAALARELLRTLEETLALHIADRDRLQRDVEASC